NVRQRFWSRHSAGRPRSHLRVVPPDASGLESRWWNRVGSRHRPQTRGSARWASVARKRARVRGNILRDAAYPLRRVVRNDEGDEQRSLVNLNHVQHSGVTDIMFQANAFLYVEDDPLSREIMAMILGGLGY